MNRFRTNQKVNIETLSVIPVEGTLDIVLIQDQTSQEAEQIGLPAHTPKNPNQCISDFAAEFGLTASDAYAIIKGGILFYEGVKIGRNSYPPVKIVLPVAFEPLPLEEIQQASGFQHARLLLERRDTAAHVIREASGSKKGITGTTTTTPDETVLELYLDSL